tara:strand:- start:192 stop:443 length:252 start_codon:yes stop_codon:yes gene_type:complete
MKQKKKFSSPKLFEYRVRYNAGVEHSALDSYHYYNAENASEALNYHNTIMRNKGVQCQNISVEKKNPYSNRWEDETDEASQYI